MRASTPADFHEPLPDAANAASAPVVITPMTNEMVSRTAAAPSSGGKTSPAIDTEPFWGKDGQTIYFTSDRGGKPQIYKTSIGSGGAERVTFIGNYNANPKLSADEKTLVMVHRQEGFTNFQIAAQDLQRGNLRVLSNTTLNDSPTVAPNGTMLIYATRQQDRGVLMLASINGRVRLPLPTAQGDVREPSWSPYLN